MATCKDCKAETDEAYCCGNSDRLCKKCAEIRYNKGIKNGIVTLGIMGPIYKSVIPPTKQEQSDQLTRMCENAYHGLAQVKQEDGINMNLNKLIGAGEG